MSLGTNKSTKESKKFDFYKTSTLLLFELTDGHDISTVFNIAQFSFISLYKYFSLGKRINKIEVVTI